MSLFAQRFHVHRHRGGVSYFGPLGPWTSCGPGMLPNPGIPRPPSRPLDWIWILSKLKETDPALLRNVGRPARGTRTVAGWRFPEMFKQAAPSLRSKSYEPFQFPHPSLHTLMRISKCLRCYMSLGLRLELISRPLPQHRSPHSRLPPQGD